MGVFDTHGTFFNADACISDFSEPSFEWFGFLEKNGLDNSEHGFSVGTIGVVILAVR